MKITLIIIIFFSTSIAYGFDFSHIDWFDSSIGFVVNPRTNIRTSDIFINNQSLFYPNSKFIFEPIPILFFRFANIFINKDGGGVAFAHFKHYKLRAIITYAGEGYKSHIFKERKNSIFLGGFIEIYNLQFKLLKDIQNVSNGYQLRVDLFKKFNSHYYSLEPHIGIQYWDKKYNNYYFGITANESSISRPSYFPSFTFNTNYELRFIYSDGRTQYLFIPMYKKYGKEILDSPTVYRDSEFRFAFGFIWKLF